jgi:hypothetical protein
MKRFVWRDGQFVDRKTGAPMDKPYAGQVVAPRVMSDIPEYRSPIDGTLITSRSQRREDLKRNDCVEVDPPKRPRGFKNERFAKRHGLPINPELKP